jgi:hypothetical protein
MGFTRLAGVSALAFAGIVMATNVALGATDWPLDADTEPGEVAKYFAEHEAVVGVEVAASLLNIVLIVIFGAGAFAMIRARERGAAWSVVGLAGIAFMPPMFVGVVALRAALIAGHDPDGVLFDLHNALFTVVGVGLSTILLGFSVGGMRTATIRRWHGYLGVISALLMLVSAMLTPVTVGKAPSGLGVIGLVGFVGWLVWLATFGIVLVKGERTMAATPVATAIEYGR